MTTPTSPSTIRKYRNLNPIAGFRQLMRHRIREIILVSSFYDSFLLAQDGRIDELMISEFMDLNIYHVPALRRVSNATEALKLISEERRLDLVISTLNISDMDAMEFARRLKKINPSVPMVLLLFDDRELKAIQYREIPEQIDRIFMWQGDFHILMAIVKLFEDELNVDHDTMMMGVQTIILVEDNIKYYSSFLPMIYTEVMNHQHNLIYDGLNLAHKLMRMAARPKILMTDSYEEATYLFRKFENSVLGVITDVEFKHNGKKDPAAGARFARYVKERSSDTPVLMQSFQEENREVAKSIGASFLKKDSPTLLKDLQKFIVNNFGFSDFLFRKEPDGEIIDRATDLRSLERKLSIIPDESVLYHASSNHFSNWLKARTEFALANQLRPSKVSDFPDTKTLRAYIINSLREFRHERSRGVVADFNVEVFDTPNSFSRIGGGSMGGKARGLAFVHHLLNTHLDNDLQKGVIITIPPSLVISTDIFDRFMEMNELKDFALNCNDEQQILDHFLGGTFPDDVRHDLAQFIHNVFYPLAVRSSSLLEDSQYQPFAGVYSTFMLPNNNPDTDIRLEALLEAIKRVYASMFSQQAKSYIKTTMYRLEEEKMAVIIQKMVGQEHNGKFYPDFSGVARSHNFYPTAPMKSEDGIVSVALGLGQIVVEGGRAFRFCPKYPKHILQLSTPQDFIENSQKRFYALDMESTDQENLVRSEGHLKSYSLDVAEEDGTLQRIGSVYSPQNDVIYDGLSRPGIRLVTFSPVLKMNLFPLSEIVDLILKLGTDGMSMPVEIEFAVNLGTSDGVPKEFVILQIRPMVLNRELEELEIRDVRKEQILCKSSTVLGVGRIEEIYDIVSVDIDSYNRAESRETAQVITRLNNELVAEDRPYLLIGVGRWGSADPWLGIPVTWDQIAGARVIVESGFRDFAVTPSQGAHFFQNITSAMVGYFTVNPDKGDGFIDWEWLRNQRILKKEKSVSHIRLDEPISVTMNGHKNQGIILKPEENP